jgi:hypothetical protein
MSLLAHALLLSISFGGQSFGMPGLTFPWEARRLRADELQVRLAPRLPAPAFPAPARQPVSAPATPLVHLPPAPKEWAPASVRSYNGGANVAVPKVLPLESKEFSKAEEPVKKPVAQPERSVQVAEQAPASAKPAPQEMRGNQVTRRELAELVANENMKLEARQEAVRQEAFKEEALKQETARQEAARVEAARQEAARQKLAEQEAAKQEQALQEAARQEAMRQNAARQEAARQDLARQEAARQEAARQKLAEQEAAKQEQALQEATRQEAIRQGAARQEAARQEAARQEAARQEAARQEAARQEAARQEAARQEAARQEAAKKEQALAERAAQEAAREDRLRQIGKQLDLERAQRENADIRSANSPLSTAGGPRRGWVFGRASPNGDMLLYAEEMARKIELNMTFDMVRELVKQPYSQPTVTIAVRADGSVEKVTFEVSSGVPALDNAIRAVIASQARYAQFPPPLARQYDVIEIRRTWIFDYAIRLQ